jgi:hypothetical protein
VGDPYRIRVPASVHEKMQEWPIPDRIRRRFLAEMRDRLGANPVAELTRAATIADEKLNVFQVVVREEAEIYVFAFSVVYDVDEKHLDILDADYQLFSSDDEPGPVM